MFCHSSGFLCRRTIEVSVDSRFANARCLLPHVARIQGILVTDCLYVNRIAGFLDKQFKIFRSGRRLRDKHSVLVARSRLCLQRGANSSRVFDIDWPVLDKHSILVAHLRFCFFLQKVNSCRAGLGFDTDWLSLRFCCSGHFHALLELAVVSV